MTQLYKYDGQTYRLEEGLTNEEAIEKIKGYVETEKPKEDVILGDEQQEDGGSIYKEEEEEATIYSEKIPFGKSLGFVEAERGIRLGYHIAADTMYHTLANIPGLLLSKKQEEQIALGKPIEEVANQSQIKLMSGYLYKGLKDLKNIHEKRIDKLGETKTIAGKVYEGLGAAPGTVAQYVTGLRAVQALQVVPKMAQFAVGFGAVDALRESDKGKLAATKAFAQGATIGKYLEWAGPLAPFSRVTSTGALGFALPAENAGDRIANAILFGGMSAIGPIYGEKTIIEKKLSETIKNNRERKAKKAFESKMEEGTKSLEKSINEYNALEKQRKDLKSKKQDTKQIDEQVEAKATEVLTLSTVLNEMETISYRIHQEKLDTTNPKSARLQMVKFDEKTNQIMPKHQDLTKNYIAGLVEKYALPPSLALKRFPQAKYVIDLLNIYRIENEALVLKFLDDPQYAKIENNTALKLLKSEPGENGMMYYFNKLNKNEQAKLIDAMLKIERDTALLMSKKTDAKVKENLAPLFDSKTFEIKPDSLTTKYKLSDSQSLAYLQIREKLMEVREHYNTTVKQFSEGKIAEIPNIPNYVPHIFLGEYKIFIDTVSKEGVRTTNEIRTANTRVGANAIKKEALKKDPNALVDIKESEKGYRGQDATISYFADAVSHSRIKGDKAVTFREMFNDLLANKASTVFGSTKLKRKQDFMKGFAGSVKNKKQVSDFEIAMNAYVEGAIKAANKVKLQQKLIQFLTRPIIDGKVYTRLTREGFKPDSNVTIAKLYPESTRYVTKLVDVALGNEKSAITKKIAEAGSSLVAKQMSKNQIDRAFGGINQITSQFYLFTYNARFLLAQGIQPYQMILPKLAHLRDLYGGRAIDPYAAMIDAMKNIARPDAFSTKVIKKAQEMFALNEKFMREFAGENLYQKQGRGSDNLFKRGLWKLSGRGLAGRVEQFSRLNATLMFAHLMRRAGLKEKTIIDNAWYLTDNYMVRYDLFDRPMMYTEGGLGILGKPMGLFKTFQQNYYAQMIEHVRNAKRYGDVSGLAHFVGGMVLISGSMGVLGINAADYLIKQLNKISPINIPQPSSFLMKIGMPDFLLYGIPSASTKIDLTATLAAPGIGPGSIFSMPGWEQTTKMANGAFDILFRYMLSKGVQSGVGKIKNAFGDESSTIPLLVPPTKGEMLDAYKAFTPKLFHGPLEQFFQGDNPMFVSKGQARLKRDLFDWYARYLSSYSLKEAKILKITWQLNQLNRGREFTYDNLMDYAVSEIRRLPPDVALAPWIFELAKDLGYSESQVIRSIKTRMKNMDRDLLDNVTKGNVMGPNRKLKQEELKFILDNIDINELRNEKEKIPLNIKEEDLY